jgi:hypothetical protein
MRNERETKKSHVWERGTTRVWMLLCVNYNCRGGVWYLQTTHDRVWMGMTNATGGDMESE